MLNNIEDGISKRIELLQEISDTLLSYIYTASIIIGEAIERKKKIFLFGNGQNMINVDTLGKYLKKNENASINSLCEDMVVVEKIASKFGADRIFDKQLESKLEENDLLIGFSTSGNSKNILRALSLGRHLGCRTIGLSGFDGGFMSEFCDVNIVVPSDDIVKIQEMHMIIGNIISSQVLEESISNLN